MGNIAILNTLLAEGNNKGEYAMHSCDACMNAGKGTASVGGTQVHRSKFAYAPPGSKPSEWKLPIHDANHVHYALARFNQAQLPAGAKSGVLTKILHEAKKHGIKHGDTVKAFGLAVGHRLPNVSRQRTGRGATGGHRPPNPSMKRGMQHIKRPKPMYGGGFAALSVEVGR